MCFLTAAFGQSLINIDSLLSNDLAKDSTLNGKWKYYPESAAIQKVDKPELNKIFPNLIFYKASLLNILGRHVNTYTCLILYDTAKTKVQLIEPMSYSNQNEIFLNSFIGLKFQESQALLNVVSELQDLLIVGIDGKFDNTLYQENKVTFDFTVIGSEKFDIVKTCEVLLLEKSILGFNFNNPRRRKNRSIL